MKTEISNWINYAAEQALRKIRNFYLISWCGNSIFYVAEQGIEVPKLPFLLYKNSLKNAKFSGFYTSKKIFGD